METASAGEKPEKVQRKKIIILVINTYGRMVTSQ